MSSRPMPEIEGVRHSYVEVRGIRIHVAEAGEGPPLVLLHGWPQHWYEWRSLIGPLSERHRVICPDLRGFGWSDAPPDGYRKENLARDVLALLDEIEVERFGLIGHDWGGWIGFILCLWEPQRVQRYLALNVAHPFSGPSLSGLATLWRFWYQWVLSAPLLGSWAASRMSTVGSGVFRWVGTGAWSEEEMRVFLGQFAEPARARATVQLYRTFVLYETAEMIRGRYRSLRLRTPTLLLYGTGDKVIRPAHIAGYERYADEMSVELVPGCGHFIVDERPDLVLERAQSFFG